MKFRIMDRTGHTTEAFEKGDKVSMEAAEKRFAEITGRGFTAVEPKGEDKAVRVLKGFDPTVEDVLFIPALQGG